MTLRTRKPAPPLDRYVDCLWSVVDEASSYERERALPTGTVELVINLGEEPMRIFRSDEDLAGASFRDAVVCGPQSGFFVLDTSRPKAVAGVHFRPGGAAAFLGPSMGEFCDLHIDPDDAWDLRTRSLRERLMEAPDAEARFDLVESALLERLHRPQAFHPAVAHALQRFTASPQTTRIDEVRYETGYAAKRFIELFRGTVGLPPKAFCRIRRFQKVIDSVALSRRVEWAVVAADSGYCDQPHLNREFRAFAGVAPGEYRPVSAERPNHVAFQR